MAKRFDFDPQIIQSVVGGQSAIDMPALNIQTLQEADSFLKGYGFDFNKSDDVERLWYFHRRAMVLMTEKLNFSKDEIPSELSERRSLEDMRKLLLFASQTENENLQKWSCAILRCLHVFVHAENDLFSSFSEEIQRQILAPIQASIYHDGTTGKTFLKKAEGSPNSGIDMIELAGFESKPFKTSSSTVIKLLAKPNALAMSIFDKLGVRFITKSVFDTYQVVRFLVAENLISYPHIMPDQSSNNLYPAVLFLKAAEEIKKSGRKIENEFVDHFFGEFLKKNIDGVDVLRKENAFSGADYRFIKFISRKLIRISPPGTETMQNSQISFFYPFEVQIVDRESVEKIKSGPSEHQAYKERQRLAARKRLFPEPM